MTFNCMMGLSAGQCLLHDSFLKRFLITCVMEFALWVDLILVKFLNFSSYCLSCLVGEGLFSLF